MDYIAGDMRKTIAAFEDFFHKHYSERIQSLVDGYSIHHRSLVINWKLLDEYKSELAADLRHNPESMLACAEQALEAFHLAEHTTVSDAVSGHVRVRVRGLPTALPVDALTSEYRGDVDPRRLPRARDKWCISGDHDSSV